MLSPQQSSPAVSHSMRQKMGSEEINIQADIKPFSLRQYVLASRHRSILHSWPFPEKYLQMCINCGLRDVLPPFGLHTSATESLKGCSNLNCFQDAKVVDFCKIKVLDHIEQPQSIKTECDLYSNEERSKVTANSQDCSSSYEDGNLHKCSVAVSSSLQADTFGMPSLTHVHKGIQTLISSKKFKDKRRRHKGRCKKRSMVDILAVAKHCTLEDIYRLNKFCYVETGIEGFHQTIPLENIFKSELADEGSYAKVGRDAHEVDDVDVMGKRTLVFKIKLNGCKSNL